MIFWAALPTEQWIYVLRERHHKHPWAVIVGGRVRARCTEQYEADEIAVTLRQAFEMTTKHAGRRAE